VVGQEGKRWPRLRGSPEWAGPRGETVIWTAEGPRLSEYERVLVRTRRRSLWALLGWLAASGALAWAVARAVSLIR